MLTHQIDPPAERPSPEQRDEWAEQEAEQSYDWEREDSVTQPPTEKENVVSESIVGKFVGKSAKDCGEMLDRLEAEHRVRMTTLRAFVKAQAAEEEATEKGAPADA